MLYLMPEETCCISCQKKPWREDGLAAHTHPCVWNKPYMGEAVEKADSFIAVCIQKFAGLDNAKVVYLGHCNSAWVCRLSKVILRLWKRL